MPSIETILINVGYMAIVFGATALLAYLTPADPRDGSRSDNILSLVQWPIWSNFALSLSGILPFGTEWTPGHVVVGLVFLIIGFERLRTVRRLQIKLAAAERRLTDEG